MRSTLPPAVQIRFDEQGRVWVRQEEGEWTLTDLVEGQTFTVAISIPDAAQAPK